MSRLAWLLPLALAACQVAVDATGGQFACPDGVCPVGYECVGGLCRSDVPRDGGVSGPDARYFPPGCGDGELTVDEACDLGAANADDGRCLLDCRVARCGDGHVRREVEACDPGVAGDGCTSGCLRCLAPLGAEAQGACFTRVDGAFTWSSAFFGCEPLGSQLATLTTMDQHVAAATTLAAGGSAWIGAYASGQWLGDEYDGDFAMWAPGEPSLEGPDVRLYLAVDEPGGVGSWYTGDEQTERAYICERRPSLVYPGDGRAFVIHHLQQGADTAAARCPHGLGEIGEPALQDYLVGVLRPQRFVSHLYCALVDGTCQKLVSDGVTLSVVEPCVASGAPCQALCALP